MLGQWKQEGKGVGRLKIPGFLNTPKSSSTSRAASILKSTNKPKPKSTDTQSTLRRPLPLPRKSSMKSMTEFPPHHHSTKGKGLPEHTYCVEQIKTVQNTGEQRNH